MSEQYTPTKKPPSGYKWMKPGERYGAIVTIERITTRKWKCLCDCGVIFETYGTHLRSGVTQSCGHWRSAPNPASYNAVHLRIARERGPASGRDCKDCGKPANDWSYSRSGVSEITELRGDYLVVFSTDTSQYDPRCKRCHNHLDHKYGGHK